jgi:cytochrome c-type biogenesis protein CcmH/NrfF
MGDSGSSSSIAEELLQLLNANESGLSDEQISNHFGSRYGELVPILNDLLSMNRLDYFIAYLQLLAPRRTFFYRIRHIKAITLILMKKLIMMTELTSIIEYTYIYIQIYIYIHNICIYT